MKAVRKRYIFLVILVVLLSLYKHSIFVAIWQAYQALGPVVGDVIILTIFATILIVSLCTLGCYFELKRKALLLEVSNRVEELANIVSISKTAITEYEQWLFNRYYYAESATVEKLAPAKWILIALEQKLEVAKLVSGSVSEKILISYLNQEIEISRSPVEILVFCQSSKKLPEKLDIKQCAYIMGLTLKAVRQDLNRIEYLASKNQKYAFLA